MFGGRIVAKAIGCDSDRFHSGSLNHQWKARLFVGFGAGAACSITETVMAVMISIQPL